MKESTKKNLNLFQRIIVAVDGADSSMKAVEKAIGLSKKTDIPLSALYVIDMNIYSKTLASDQISRQWQSMLKGEGETVLNKVQNLGNANNVPVETMLLDGNPGEKIIEEAKQDDIIIMGNKGKNTIERIFIGSVSEHVLHHADSSVMIVR